MVTHTAGVPAAGTKHLLSWLLMLKNIYHTPKKEKRKNEIERSIGE
jgi:hypothetical protein